MQGSHGGSCAPEVVADSDHVADRLVVRPDLEVRVVDEPHLLNEQLRDVRVVVDREKRGLVVAVARLEEEAPPQRIGAGYHVKPFARREAGVDVLIEKALLLAPLDAWYGRVVLLGSTRRVATPVVLRVRTLDARCTEDARKAVCHWRHFLGFSATGMRRRGRSPSARDAARAYRGCASGARRQTTGSRASERITMGVWKIKTTRGAVSSFARKQIYMGGVSMRSAQ